MNEDSRHCVCVHRTNTGMRRYVGYGASVPRFAAHAGKHAHNAALTAALAKGNYTLEVAGPLGNEQSQGS